MADLIEDIVKDTAGVPVAGAKGYVYVDGILATGAQLVDDAGVNLSNPLTTDAFGHYKAHVTFAIEYAIKWNWLGRERYIEVHRSDAGVAASAGAAATSAGAAAASAATAAAYTSAKTANTASLIAAANINGFFPEEAVRTAVTAPNDIPTVAVGAAGAASTINGRAQANPLLQMTDTKIKFLAGVAAGSYGTGGWKARGAYYGAGSYTNQYASMEFNHTGTVLEIATKGNFNSASGNMRALVGDREAASWTVTYNDGAYYYVKLTFPTSATRRIRIEGDAGFFIGVNVTAAGEITATGRTYPLVTLIGDSFVEGTGADKGWSGESVMALRAIGVNPAVAGVGGTGLLQPGTRTNWQDATRILDLTLSGVTDTITGAAAPPAMGVVCLSINDNSSLSAVWGGAATLKQALKTALWKLVDAWIAANSGKPLVFVGPTWVAGTAPVLSIYEIRDAAAEVAAAARKSNVHFIDRLGPDAKLRSGANTYLSTTGNIHTTTTVDGLASTSGVVVDAACYISGVRCGSVVSIGAGSVVLSKAASATTNGVTVEFRSNQTALYTYNGSGDQTHPSQDGHNLDAIWLKNEFERLIFCVFA